MHLGLEKARRTTALPLRGLGALHWILFAGLFLSCKKPESVPLHVRIGGCNLLAERTSGFLCAVKARSGKPLLFAIEGPPSAQLTTRIGNDAARQQDIPASGQVTFPVSVPAVASQVMLHVKSPAGSADCSVDIQPGVGFNKALAKDESLDCSKSVRDCLHAVQDMSNSLDSGLQTLDAAERAYLRGLLSRKLWEKARRAAPTDDVSALDKLAITVSAQAMVEAHASGLLSVEAWSLFFHAWVLRDQGAAYAPHLVEKLDDPVHERAIDLCPEAAINLRLQQSKIAEELGDLAASRRYASQADALSAQFISDPSIQLGVLQQLALAAQYLQETAEAERLIGQVEKQIPSGCEENPCVRAGQHNRLGWIRLVGRQTGAQRSDPEASFQKASECLLRCEDPSAQGPQRAILSTNRALYAMQQAEEAAPESLERRLRLEAAEKLTAEAVVAHFKASRTIQRENKLDLADLKARSALLRKQGWDALHSFDELEKLTSSERFTPYYRWASQVGKAEASLVLGDKPAALTYFAQAETLLNRMTDGLPMMSRRQLFLRQFQIGTGRYLALLLDAHKSPETILHAIRNAHVRALRVYARGPSARSGQERTAELLAQYRRLLDEREAAIAERQIVPDSQLKGIDLHLNDLQQQQEKILGLLYASPSSEAQIRWRMPAAGELLIACHPLSARDQGARREWVCAGATEREIKLVRITAPTIEAPERAAEELLAALGDTLQQATQLHILPYGPLRNVAWAALPFSGGRIEDRFAVSYGVDLPADGRAASHSDGGALLVTNPEQNLPGARRAGEMLRRDLLASGQPLLAREGRPSHGGYVLDLPFNRLLKTQIPPALPQEVLAKLPDVNLFIFYGHAESSRAGGWDSRLLFSEDGRISAQDIMALRAVPPQVLLIGCETAVSDRDAPADEAGLAQAFVLRGSAAVLATNRTVSDEVAEALVGELARLGAFRRGGLPLATALRKAVAALRPRLPAADLDAFRVYTP